ncbi:MAG: cupin domain-containing protein [Gemmatimonadota bacterium]
MPKIGKADIADVVRLEGYEGRLAQLGMYTVAFETYTAESDPSPLFKGLPGDRCQCPHWGVVLKGSVTFRTHDGDMTVGEGEAYYAPPGHLPLLHAGTEVVEFSPTEELNKTFAVIERNIATST